MTSMFVVIFVEQWLKDKSHTSALLGIVLSVVSLLIFGPENFVIPSMILMLLALTLLRPRLEQINERNITDDKKGGKA